MKSLVRSKWSIRIFASTAAIAVSCFLSSCGPNENSPRGFRLPEGNSEQGQLAFSKFGCIQCHSIEGVEDTYNTPDNRATYVVLGGEVRRVKTYGDLVTSIINPSHRIKDPGDPNQVTEDGESAMPDFTNTMTVSEMIDLVAFLHPHYKRTNPEYSISDSYYGYNQIP